MQQWDREEHFPKEELQQIARLGFGGIYASEEHGGSGLSREDAAVIFEALSQGCVSTTAYLSIHNMVCWMIDKYGTNDQRSRFVPALTCMDSFGSYCLTEAGSGSDAAAMRTTAVRKGDDYVLNGSKAFISGGGDTDIYLIMARTGGEGAKGVSAFIVPRDAPGLSFGGKERKLGWNSQPTRAVLLDDCKIPAENLLSTEGKGFSIAMNGLNGGRINIAACSVGGAQQALYDTVSYTQERRQFGSAIADNQAVQFRLAEMATSLHVSRQTVRFAARQLDAGHPGAANYCAMAKLAATDNCSEIVNGCLQLHGGYGYLKDYKVQQFFRDLRVHQILEGTNEVMRMIISRDILAHWNLGSLNEISFVEADVAATTSHSIGWHPHISDLASTHNLTPAGNPHWRKQPLHTTIEIVTVA